MKLQRNLLNNGLWLVALSGGADSVALTLLLKQEHINIHALHCNFHLRGEESERDEHFVRTFCLEHEIPLLTVNFDTRTEADSNKESIEMAARRLRYSWFEKMQQEMNAEGICVAHHRDDQAETILMNLIRGTGIRGLMGMQEDRMLGKLKVVRPILNATKTEILDFLAANGQTYVTDSSNLERECLRNRIRLNVIPLLKELNPNIIDCIARTADNIVNSGYSEDTYFQRLSPLGFTRTQIIDIRNHTGNTASGKQWHSATHTVTLDRGKIIVESSNILPALPSVKVERTKNAVFSKDYAFVDAATVNAPLSVRQARRGDRFRPYGMNHGSKLLSDFLTDRKVPLNEKLRQLVVVDQTDAIVWVVNHEIDNRFRISPETKDILKISLS